MPFISEELFQRLPYRKSKCETGDPCGYIYTYTINGLKEDKVSLTFNYKSSSKDTKYETRATYELEVDSNLNVKELSHSGTYFEK